MNAPTETSPTISQGYQGLRVKYPRGGGSAPRRRTVRSKRPFNVLGTGLDTDGLRTAFQQMPVVIEVWTGWTGLSLLRKREVYRQRAVAARAMQTAHSK